MPDGFDPERLDTWPRVDGRLEWVNGRLLYMPPRGVMQQETVSDVVVVLGIWSRSQGDFVVGTGEAGMLLGGSVRAADAAVWRRQTGEEPSHEVRRRPPVLAVEVAGRDDTEAVLRDKARWCLDVGVEVVWIALPETEEVVVIQADGETRHRGDQKIPERASLPGLQPVVRELFRQIART